MDLTPVTSPPEAQRALLPNPLLIDFPPTGFLNDGVSSDPAIGAAFKADPLKADQISVSTGAQTVAGMAYAGYNAKNFTKPTLVLHGNNDGVVPVELGINWFNAVGSPDNHMVIFEGLKHEIMNETSRNQVIDTAIGWLDQH